MIILRNLVVFTSVALTLAGCAGLGQPAAVRVDAAPQVPARQLDAEISIARSIGQAAYAIADRLAANAIEPLGPTDTVLVASFVSINNLEESSTFGRLMAEQIASRFAQRGTRVIELKVRQQSVFIKEGKGEFMLSRDVRAISASHNVSGIVVGTYADAGDLVYVSARIVRPADNVIRSATDFGIPLDPSVVSAALRGRSAEVRRAATECFLRGAETEECRALRALDSGYRREGDPARR